MNHGILRSQAQKSRDELVHHMDQYYYNTKVVTSFWVTHYIPLNPFMEQDTVYSSWSDSQMRDWLIEHNIIKSDAQVQREKLQKLVQENYANAKGASVGLNSIQS